MKVHALYHVPFEGPGHIAEWIGEKGYSLAETRTYQKEKMPETGDFDMLIIMGGPMNVHDDLLYPWLKEEKTLISKAIHEEKLVIGICLGAQLIALALGSSVFRNRKPEIGWFPVYFDNGHPAGNPYKTGTTIMTFHWHGDAFDLPEGSLRLAFSAATDNQAFLYNDRVLGIQFHPEVRSGDIRQMIEGTGTGLKKDDFVQTADEMLAATDFYGENHALLETWLEKLVKQHMPD